MTETREQVPDQGASGRRPEIQGLRALAALLVVVYHLWPHRLSGGFIGVDVFFVISGFLITGQLLQESGRTGRVRLARFWARRARRLLPAAYLVLALTAVATWLWVPSVHWGRWFKEITASALYVENWSLARDAVDYLAADDAASAVQHYWTLSIEEQFYLVWPLLVVAGLLLARRLRLPARRTVVVLLALVVAASAAYAAWLVQVRPPEAFFVTPARAWEFGAGGLLYALVPGTGRRGHPQARAALALAGLAGIVACGLLLGDDTTTPGPTTVLVVLAAAAVLAAGHADVRWSPTRLLAARPAQVVGDLSYAIYLWHWPLIVIGPYALGRDLDTADRWAILALTFALAWASTRLVEDPIRHGRWLSARRPVTQLAVAALAAVVLGGATGAAWFHQRDALGDDREQLALAVAHPPACFGAAAIAPGSDCEVTRSDRPWVPSTRLSTMDRDAGQDCATRPPGEPIKRCRGGRWDDPDVPKVALIGDSHARMLLPALDELADEGLLAYEGFFQNGCLWTADPPYDTIWGPECVSFKQKLAPLLDREQDRFDVFMTSGKISNLAGSPREQVAGLLKAWDQVTSNGHRVIAMTDTPEFHDDVQDCLAGATPATVGDCAAPRDEVLAENDPMALAAAASPDVDVLDLRPFYCDERTCPIVIGGVAVYADGHHLTATYAKTIAPFMEKRLRKLDVLR